MLTYTKPCTLLSDFQAIRICSDHVSLPSYGLFSFLHRSCK